MKRFLQHLLPALVLVTAGALFLPTAAQAWWNNDWTLRKRVTIDTTPNGGGITDPLGTPAVLVRLSDLNFGAAKEDGSDIRIIAADDKTPLPFHIEKFDSLMGAAFVWVKVPDLKPGAVTTFYLYYGNQGNLTGPGASEKGTFDDDTTLVYHFSENNAPAHDASGQGNDSTTPIQSTDSLIGSGLRLGGKTPVTIPNSASLAWTDGGSLTWSAWIKPMALQPNAIIYSRRDGSKDFLIGLDNGVPFVDINGTRSAAGAPVAAASWHHLAVTADGSTTTLWLDGASYGTVNASLPGLTTAATLGGDTASDSSTPSAGFIGEMDELELAKSAPPPGGIKFDAVSQGA